MKGSSRQADVTIGLDLGDKRSQAVVVDAEGNEIESPSVATTPAGMGGAFAAYEGCRVVIEVGTHSAWVGRLLTTRGFAVVVANPRTVRLIGASQRKTDRFDARMLARLGRMDVTLLSPVTHRTEATQRLRAMLRARLGLIRSRTLLVNQVRGLVKGFGVRVPASSSRVFPARVRATIDPELFPGLMALVASIEQLTEQIEALDREVATRCRTHDPNVAALQAIPGVGPITALSYVLTIEDPSRFASSRTVGAYLGLCPRLRSSGEREPQLSITHSGDVMLRSHLVQAAHYILGPFGPDCDLRRYGMRLAERGGATAKKRAVVAVARKLAVLLHHLWVTGAVYDPLLNAKRTEQHAA